MSKASGNRGTEVREVDASPRPGAHQSPGIPWVCIHHSVTEDQPPILALVYNITGWSVHKLFLQALGHPLQFTEVLNFLLITSVFLLSQCLSFLIIQLWGQPLWSLPTTEKHNPASSLDPALGTV